MKKQRDHFLSGWEYTKEHPDQPLYFLGRADLDKLRYLELIRFLFKEDIKVVHFENSGFGFFSPQDRDTIKNWFGEHMFAGGSATFPDFRKMYDDIRDTGLRIAKFDIYYGFAERDFVKHMSDAYVNFYCSVMDSMTGRFYGVKQPSESDMYVGPKNVWMFYFENENDHILFSSLVDMEIEAKSDIGFQPPPQPDRIVRHLDFGSVSTGYVMANTISGLQLVSPPKFRMTGKLVHNPDGTVTIEEV